MNTELANLDEKERQSWFSVEKIAQYVKRHQDLQDVQKKNNAEDYRVIFIVILKREHANLK